MNQYIKYAYVRIATNIGITEKQKPLIRGCNLTSPRSVSAPQTFPYSLKTILN